jgi:hypothetical protein
MSREIPATNRALEAKSQGHARSRSGLDVAAVRRLVAGSGKQLPSAGRARPAGSAVERIAARVEGRLDRR